MTLISQNLCDKIKAINIVGILLLFSQTKPVPTGYYNKIMYVKYFN